MSLLFIRMATRKIHISLPGELNGFVERKVSGGRYQDASELVRDALRRMEAAELADDLREFERAFAGGHDRPETAEDILRVEAAVKTARKR
jgi:putative addiction module CopG family antidote